MILFLCAFPLFSEIKPIHSLEEIAIDKFSGKILVMFDLDDVLVYPQDALLQNWRAGWKPEGIRAWTAEEDTLAWMHADFQLMDPYGPRCLDTLYERGIPTIGFTSFAMDQSGIVESIPAWRTQHLNKLGLYFHEKDEVIFSIEEGFIPPSFEKGLLCCGNRYKKDKDNKGKILSLYLDWISWTPELIVLVEDDRKNLESVSRELERRGIPFLGLQYIPKNLDPINEQVAEIQYQTIINSKEWLPDKDVLSLFRELKNSLPK